LVTHHFDHKLDCIPYIGLKEKARARQLKGEEVPTSIKLPNLEDILKMRQRPNTNGEAEETTTNKGMEETNMNGGLEGGQMGEESFVFVANHLVVGAVLGKKE
jgi:protein involved in temperature-dependent protein secretion